MHSYSNRPISKAGLTTILNNPFYTGLIQLRKTRESFEGVHEPLISRALYDAVQMVLRGRRAGTVPLRYDFVFKQMVRCGNCGKHLIGEKQKGRYIYYRCHGPACAGTCISEAKLDAVINGTLARFRFAPEDFKDLRDVVERLKGDESAERAKREQSLRLKLGNFDVRLARLTDALIDCLVDKEEYEERRSALLAEKRYIVEALESLNTMPGNHDTIMRSLELAESASLRYKIANPVEKRDLVRATCSNSTVTGKKIEITLRSPFSELANLTSSWNCDPTGNRTPVSSVRGMRPSL